MYIVGIGRTKFGVSSKSLAELFQEAIKEALEDSDLSPKKIDFIVVSNFLGGVLNSQLHLNSLISNLFPHKNIPSVRVETACSSGATALYLTLQLLRSFDTILVVGAEKMTGPSLAEVTSGLTMAGSKELEQDAGLNFPAANALIAREYLSRYKLTHKILEDIAFISHQNANSNPLAQFYYKKVTYKDILASPVVASPLTVFDCSPISDGAACVIVSRKKPRRKAIKILASQIATDTISLIDRKDITTLPAAIKATHKALNDAHITIDKIDVFEIHDCFTIAYLTALEDLGLARPGRARNLVEDQLEKKLRIKINPRGGLKADGHPIGATGLAQICELTLQLRGEAGTRQHLSPRYALAHNIGGVGGTANVTILIQI